MREAFWVGFGLVTSVLALLAGTRFLTILLSTEEYGKLALAISLATLGVQILGDPIGKTSVRFYSGWCEAGKPYGFIQSLKKSLIYAVVCIVLLCIGTLISGYFFDISPGYYLVIVTGLFSILLILNRVAFALEDAARLRQFRGLIQGTFEAMRFLFAVGFIIIFALPRTEIVLSGFVIAGVLVVTGHGIFLYKFFITAQLVKPGGLKTVSFTVSDSMKAYQLPLILSNACIWIVMMAERWVLRYYSSSMDIGGYTAVYQLAFIPMLFISSFMVLLMEPILYQVARLDGKAAASLQTLKINHYIAFGILSVSLILFIILLFCYPTVGYLFLGAEFRPYSWIFPWLLLAGGCFASAQQLLLKLSCEMRTDLLALLWCGVAAVAVTSYIVGANYWQLKGILVAIVAVNVLFVIFLLFFFYRDKK
ncbi:MAG: hypothetical protein A2277_14965 [Desulfobacterales bacterium RIFOXYA12_FULL_46_15]|nr:MAG: hypothetical protein A2277_14965 [Desulfobacterales bacterium RIFOXYA12_FULL_46_15]